LGTTNPPRVYRPEIAPALQEIILRCLEPFAKDRYQSATQLRQLLRNFEGVTLTERAHRIKPLSTWKNFKRWFRAAGYEPSPTIKSAIANELTPLVIVALDLNNTPEALQAKMQRSLKNIMKIYTEGRVSCVTVLSDSPTFEGDDEIDSASGIMRGLLAQMMEWMAPLQLPAEKTSFHVIEAFDPAARILEFANDNEASMIIIGQAISSRPSNLVPWRSNMTKIVEEANCIVHLVKSVLVKYRG
jgi:nucleotide-binding universal stress UspA family protein